MKNDIKFTGSLPSKYLAKISELKEQYEQVSVEAKYNGVNIGEYSERFGELEEILIKLIDSNNRLIRRIKECNADIWEIANIIQLAKNKQKTRRQALENFESKRKAVKETKKKLKTKIGNLEKKFRRPSEDIEEHYRFSHFYGDEQGVKAIKNYFKAAQEADQLKFVRDQLIESKTRPLEKEITECCLYLRDIQKMKHSLIADIINLFNISPEKKQTEDTIRQRIYQAKNPSNNL